MRALTQRQKAIAMAYLVFDNTFDYFDSMEYDGRCYKWDGNFEGPIYYTQKAMAATYDELEKDPVGNRPSDMIAECAQEAGVSVEAFIEQVAAKYRLGKPKRGAKQWNSSKSFKTAISGTSSPSTAIGAKNFSTQTR